MPIEIIRSAANEGVFLRRVGDEVRLVGPSKQVKSWAPALRLVKQVLLEWARSCTHDSQGHATTTSDGEDALREAYNERAAIMEYDAGLSREKAEVMAARCVYGPYSLVTHDMLATESSITGHLPYRDPS